MRHCSYDALNKHELECGFQPQQCSGCGLQIPKKDKVNHEGRCGSIQLSCRDCKLVYKRQDAATKHSQTLCLAEQLRQVRKAFAVQERKMKELVRQLATIQSTSETRALIQLMKQRRDVVSDSPNMKRTINFSDLSDATTELKAVPNIYQGMQWTGFTYIHKEYANTECPKSGYPGAFIPNGSSHIAYFKTEGSISVQTADEVFTLVSITACATWKDGLELIITGHREARQTDVHTVILLFGKPQMILLQWENIDRVVFQSSGGTPHPETGCEDSSTQVAITQMILSAARG
jgi:hypothetical protein